MQRSLRSRFLLALAAPLLAWAGVMPLAAVSAEPGAGTGRTVQARVIVKYKPQAGAAGAERLEERLDRAVTRHGAQPQGQRALGGEVRLLTASGVDSATLARRLAADADVAYAVPDRRMRAAVELNDPLYPRGGADPEAGQWYLRPPDSLFRSAIDAESAWTDAVTRGSADVVVAVLDTGVRFDHPDLAGKLLPGYDFILKPVIAADGGGRDADASDPGDFVTAAELNGALGDEFDGCAVQSISSWHGTKVAGMVGAQTNNGKGIAGAGWDVRVLPVRVLGKCGGFESDIIAAMRWSAGIPVNGVPNLPADQQAKVINLSLGGTGRCGAAYADAVADVRARGVTVVASAGNTTGHAVSAPANCEGVIGVGGLRHIGTKVGFSDLGREVSISAPGGNCVNIQQGEPCLYPLITTTNAGERAPAAASEAYTTGTTDITFGTSFSAPLVSATAALMLAVQPDLAPDELRALLQSSATAFPTSGAANGVPQCTAPRFDADRQPIDQLECYCTTETCGAGMLNAAQAVAAAEGLVARISLVGDDDPRSGQPVTLSAVDSLFPDGQDIKGAEFTWTLVDDGGIVDGFETAQGIDNPAEQSSVTLTPSAGGAFTVRVRVEDAAGNAATQTVRVAVDGPRSGGGGGGGALGVGYLLGLLAAVAAVRRAVTAGRR